MSVPDFDLEGDLPSGIYEISLGEALKRFGQGMPQRFKVAERLVEAHRLASSTDALSKFYVFGSFVTNKQQPRDLDIFLVMEDEFDLESCADEVRELFDHERAENNLGISVFWVNRSTVDAGFIGPEDWQRKRPEGLRGIIEVIRSSE